MPFRITVLAFSLALITGCAGTIKTYTKPVGQCNSDGTSCVYEGVLYRPLTVMQRHYMHDRVLDVKGAITHHMGGEAGKRCIPVKVTEELLVPDRNNEYLIAYEPAFFENSKFGVELTANGTLSKVSSESTPGGKSLVESLVSVVTTRESILAGVQLDAALVGGDGSIDPHCSHGELGIPPEIADVE